MNGSTLLISCVFVVILGGFELSLLTPIISMAVMILFVLLRSCKVLSISLNELLDAILSLTVRAQRENLLSIITHK